MLFLFFYLLSTIQAKLEVDTNKKAEQRIVQLLMVGVAGFEPAASTSQTWRDNRATLHPELVII